jgi:aspartate racemase
VTEPLVGILGGMGPAATAAFYAKLVARTPATRDQDHLRVAIWADPTVPDRVAALLDGSTDPYPLLLAGTRHLQSLGATVAAMPCHTAHAYLPRLVSDTGMPFIDMVAETARVLRQRDLRHVALLATRGMLGSGIYQERLRDFDIVVPDERGQRSVDRAIAAVKQGELAEGGRQLSAALPDVPLTVLACTELPLAAAHLSSPPGELLDPTDLLADALIAACR